MSLAKLSVDLELKLGAFQGDSGKAAATIERDAAKMTAAQRSFARQLERVAAQATGTQAALLKTKAASLDLGDNVKIQGLINQIRQAERIKEVGASATALVRTLGGLGLVVSGGGLVALATASVRALDALNGLSASSGASVENISALDSLARRTGLEFQSLEAIVLQLGKSLNEAGPNNAQGRALRALGLDAAELRRLDPAEAVHRVAVALNGYADGGAKAAVQTALLGRQVKAGADFLRDLGQESKLVGTLTAEQAQMAESYAKALSGLKAQAEDAARSLTLRLAPALAEVLRGFNQGGIRGAFDAIGERVGLGAAFHENREIERQQAELADLQRRGRRLQFAVDRNPSSPLGAELQAVQADIEQRTTAIAAARAKYLRLTDGSAGPGRGFMNPEVVKPVLPDIADRDDEAAKAAERAAKAYRDFISSITERVSAEQAQLAGGEKLTEQQRFALDVVGKLATGEAKLSDVQKRGVTAALEGLLALEQQVEVRQRAADAAQRYADAIARSRDALVQQRAAVDVQNGQLLEQIATLGMSADEVERYHVAQLEAALATREAAIAAERANGIVDENADAVDGQTEALRRQIALRKQLATATAAQLEVDRQRAAGDSLASGLADDFGRALESARGLDELLPNIAATIQRFAIRELVTQPLEDSLRSGIRGLIGGGKIDGAASAGEAAAQAAKVAAQQAALTAQTTATVEATTAQLIASSSLEVMTTEAFKAAAALAALSSSEGTDAAGNILSALFSSSGGSGVDFGANPFAAVALADGTNRVPYDGFRATLHKDEAVVPAKYNPAAGGGYGAMRSPTVIIHEAPPVAKQTQNADGSMEFWFERAVSASVAETERRMASGGSTDRVMRGTYGVRRNLARRD